MMIPSQLQTTMTTVPQCEGIDAQREAARVFLGKETRAGAGVGAREGVGDAAVVWGLGDSQKRRSGKCGSRVGVSDGLHARGRLHLMLARKASRECRCTGTLM